MMALSPTSDEPVDSLALRCARLGEDLVDAAQAAALARAALGPEVAVEVACRRAVSTLLVQAVVARPDQAVAERRQLGELWLGEVLRWCHWLCGRRLDPQDLAYEVLVLLIARAHQIRDPAATEAWLRRVTHHAVRAATRRAWFRLRAPDEPAEPVAPGPDAEAQLGRAQRLALVRAVLDEQRLAYREVLVLHYMEGLSRAEIARQLDLPAGTLGRRLTRARADFERRARRRGLDTHLPQADEGRRS